MGHSDASYVEATEAADKGVRYAVHTFNAMRQLAHRDSGIVGAVLSDDRIFAEIIADGIHVAPEIVRVFARAKGPSRIILATDAISATGMPDGSYALGRHHVDVVGGVCRDLEWRLAGSTFSAIHFPSADHADGPSGLAGSPKTKRSAPPPSASLS